MIEPHQCRFVATMYGSTTYLCVPIGQLEFWIVSCRNLNPISTLLPNQKIPTRAKMEDRVWLSIGCPEQYMAQRNSNRLIGIILWSWPPPFVPTSYSGEKLEFKTHHDPVKIVVATHCFSPAPCSLCCWVKQNAWCSVRENRFHFEYNNVEYFGVVDIDLFHAEEEFGRPPTSNQYFLTPTVLIIHTNATIAMHIMAW
jgi:hypothetical protein